MSASGEGGINGIMEELFIRSMSFPEKMLLFLQEDNDFLYWDSTGREVVINEAKLKVKGKELKKEPSSGNRMVQHLPLHSLSCMLRLFVAFGFQVKKSCHEDEIVTVCSHPRFLKEGLPDAEKEQESESKIGLKNVKSTEIQLETYKRASKEKYLVCKEDSGNYLDSVVDEFHKQEKQLHMIVNSVVSSRPKKPSKRSKRSRVRCGKHSGKERHLHKLSKSRRKAGKSKKKDKKTRKSKGTDGSKTSKTKSAKGKPKTSSVEVTSQQQNTNQNLIYPNNLVPGALVVPSLPNVQYPSVFPQQTQNPIPHMSAVGMPMFPAQRVVSPYISNQQLSTVFQQVVPNTLPFQNITIPQMTSPIVQPQFAHYLPTLMQAHQIPVPSLQLMPNVVQQPVQSHSAPLSQEMAQPFNMIPPFNMVSPQNSLMIRHFQNYQSISSDAASVSGLVFPSGKKTGNYLVKMVNKDNSDQPIHID